MSEFEGASAAPAGAPDPGLAAQLSGPWMKALLADEEEAAGTDLFSQLTPTPPTPQPASGDLFPGHAPTICIGPRLRSAVQLTASHSWEAPGSSWGMPSLHVSETDLVGAEPRKRK